MLDATHRVPGCTVVVVGRIEVVGVVVQVLAVSTRAVLGTRPQVAVAANIANSAGGGGAITLIASTPCITKERISQRNKKSKAMHRMAVIWGNKIHLKTALGCHNRPIP